MVESLRTLQRQLFVACEHGDLLAVQAILDQDEASSFVDTDDGEGFTPLQMAAGNGHEEIVRLLLMRGASLDRQNIYGWTALMQAASHGHTDVVALLLQNKANPSIHNKLGATALTVATHYEQISVVRLFISLGLLESLNDDPCDITTGQAFSSVMVAALNGHEALLKLLLDRGGNQFQVHRPTGWSPLMMAALRGHVKLAKMLVENRGCDPNVANLLNRTALEIAILGNHGDVKLYLDSRTTNRPKLLADNSKPKIVEAAESGDVKLVQRILDVDPRQCNKLSPEGATPLMIAVMIGRRDIAELLVQYGADINMQDTNSGWTALMQATFHRRHELVKFLIDSGADVNIQAADGSKALDLALVIVMNEQDKASNELISLLASVTMPIATNNKPTSSIMSGSSTLTSTTSTSHLEEESRKNGLKAWWSRMSNRFRNLKLSRTLRAGLSVTPLTPFEDESSLPPVITHKVSPDAGARMNQVDDRKAKRKTSMERSSELGRSRNSASQRPSDKLLPVVPPFLPPPRFQLRSADRISRTHHPQHPQSKTSLSQLAKGQTATTSGRVGRPPTKFMISRRSSSINGISPSNSTHFSTAASPSSSAEAGALSRGGLVGGTRTASLNQKAMGTTTGEPASKLSVVVEPLFTPVHSIQPVEQSKHSPHGQVRTARFPPVAAAAAPSIGASSASSTISGSLPNAKPRPVSGVSRSTSPTLTPSPSPVPKTGGAGSSCDKAPGGNLVDRNASPMLQKESSSSGISEDDELSTLLKRLSLEKYALIFEEQEVDMEAFLTLNESDLKEMGIASTEPLQQILGAITELKDGHTAYPMNVPYSAQPTSTCKVSNC